MGRTDDRLARRGGAVELLRAPAAFYGVAVRCRNRLYDRGWLRAERLDLPVVSVGNLTAGGTGKTPLVAWVARELERRGLPPGISTRGYKAPRGMAGDETLLLAELLPGSLYAEDPDRVRGARQLAELGAGAVVLDDGFQHRRLARDLDLVLVDATRPWGLAVDAAGRSVRALLPRGLLREPPEALARADLILVTRADQVGEERLRAHERELSGLAPHVPLARAAHRPVALREERDGRTSRRPLEDLRGRPVDLASGIGNPEAFEASVRALGARIERHARFGDHHAWSARDLAGLGEGGRWLVTTAKDAVKLRGLVPELRVLEIEIEILSGAAPLEAMLDGVARPRGEHARAARPAGLHG
ncbi:MAG TPA: tetraacyldisaccharide 4'-kinase [Planctomycetota bacterium]|nr:tetraacyldisaccharide 4'-kinase [Planctomycetota bacterium]